MADTSDLLGLTISISSTTLLLAGVAGLMPRLVGDEPNAVAGIRTKATMSSAEAWRSAHRVAQPILRWTVWTGVAGLGIQTAIGLVAGFASVTSAVAAVIVCAATFIILIYAALKGNAAAKAMERRPGDTSRF
ncbi:SdpI family protein [Prescottella sp. R16]|uniref:SdpI family protein n=1 Tax=Prescottella sp. R16 TaxID=3064529 RepID=UPI00272E021E|nr:SdpI family protein [Prescottella sp. R16]